MRLFFDTDLEGATGVFNMSMVYRGDPLFDYAYTQLAKDINAALAGAFDGGAQECRVSDGHGEQGLDWSQIDPRALPGDFDSNWSFDAMFLIGNHAQAGTQNAFLDHTQSASTWFRYTVNGRPTGEIGQSAMQSALVGAPVILVTGGEAAITEAHNFLGEIETVAVKRGIGRNHCQMYDPDKSRRRIYQAAKQAVIDYRSGEKTFSLYKPSLPAICELTYTRSDYADQAMAYTTRAERIDARTIRWVAQNYTEIFP